MAKREKILVGLMVAALCWGVISILGRGGKQPDRAETARQEPVAATNAPAPAVSTTVLNKAGGSGNIAALVARAGRPWESDPFFPSQEAEAGQAQNAKDSPMVYSGLVRMQDKAAAIISGAEYQEGDSIAAGPYAVKEIRTNCVVLRHTGTGETSFLHRVEMNQ